MSNATESISRYFQLTPEILVEYTYNNVSRMYDMHGDATGYIRDLAENESNGGTQAYVVNNGYLGSRTFLWKSEKNKFVIPVNKSESKFISYKPEDVNGDVHAIPFESSGNEDMNDDVLIDTFRLHFTSRNYLGSYDGFILTLYVYDTKKNKVGLLSQYIKRTDDPNINKTPVLINQKMYTTYMDFVIPNIQAMLQSEELGAAQQGEGELKSKLFTKYPMLENSPMVMNIYGVKASYNVNGVDYYNTEKLNSIYIPVVDKSNNLHIEVKEADDGDYFVIYPEIDNSRVSFSDYIYNLSDGHPEQYIVFYELTLTEVYTPNFSNEPVYDITHKEQYIINAAQEVQDNGDTVLEMNERELDGIMYYRPVLMHSGKLICFIIDIRLNIINTFDNTTTVRKSSIGYGDPAKSADIQTKRNLTYFIAESPKKYGKKMSRIYLGEVPAQVNVYNKKPDIDVDGVKITNASSNVKIENHQHSVIGFIECANVGVTIEQVPKEVLTT